MSPPNGTAADSQLDPDNGVVFTFGLIADVQYADIDDGHDFSKTRQRYYRNAISQLTDAVRHWQARRDVAFVLQLGDLIDGQNRRQGESDAALKKTLDVCAQFNGQMYHVWGNHELYNYTKQELAESQLNSSRLHQETLLTNIQRDTDIDATSNGPSDSPHCNYYHFSPMSGFRVVVIDTYDVGALGYEATSTDPRLAEATRILAEKNPNTDKNSPLGMHGLDTRFVKYNGAVGQRQLQWLRRVLREANTAREKVFIAGHIPIYVESASPVNICWNYGEVLDVIHDFPECIIAYISGHDHDGGRAIDDHGIQHVTIEAVIETPPGVSAFATVHVHRDRVVVDGGGGRLTTTVMYLSS